MAQQRTAPDSTNKKFYVGVGASSIGFNLEYQDEPKSGDFRPVISLHGGYKLNKRVSLQIGFSYGNNTDKYDYVYVEAQDKLIYYSEISQTRAIAIPVTLKYGFLYPFRHLQFYGTTILTPIISSTSLKKTEQREDVTTVTYNTKASGFNAYLTAGFGLNYTISKRLDMYGELHLLHRSFNRDWPRKTSILTLAL